MRERNRSHRTPRRRAARTLGLALALALLGTAPARPQVQTRTAASRGAPALLLVGGKVFTADSTRPWAEAVAIGGERITAVGTTAEIRALAGPGTRVIDVGGRVIVPGFNDAHDHVRGGDPGIFVEMGTPMVDPSPATVLDSLRAATARVPAGTWIQADIWLSALNDASLRRAALDRVAPHHPVLLEMPTGHGMVLNTAAMRALGIGDAEPDPLGGWYERDARGRLTGRLDEYAGWSALRRLRSSLPDSVLVTNLRAYAARELHYGITSVQDIASNMDPATAVRVLARAKLPLRMRVIRFSMPNATSLNTGEWEGIPEHPAPKLVVWGRKWILDGTPVEQNALARHAYPGRPDWHGRLDFPVDSVREMLAAALRGREQIVIHAGDSAQAIVLGLMESLAPDSAWRPLRVRFEHGMASPDLWPRAAAKGIVIVNNLQLLPPPPISRHLPPIPLAAVLPQGMVGGLGSDGEPRSPFAGMWYALSFPFQPQIPRELIVRAYTAGSAYAEFAEAEKGTLAPGMLADLAVLSQDIFTVPVDELPKTESVLTLVGGKVEYDAGVLEGGPAAGAAVTPSGHSTQSGETPRATPAAGAISTPASDRAGELRSDDGPPRAARRVAVVRPVALRTTVGGRGDAAPPRVAHTAVAAVRDGGRAAAAPPVVTVVARDFVFSLPTPRSVPAGPVTIRMINEGKEIHMMGVVWLDRHTVPEFVAAVRADSGFAGTYEAGGPNAVAPGDTAVATVLLPPGHVALACWVVGEDGKMHVLKGMVAPLEVVPAHGAPAAEPRADLSLTLRDYAIEVAGTATAGRRTFRVDNRGPQEHDVELFRMMPGATMADVAAWLDHPSKGSPRARPLGGMVGIERGHHGFFTADLVPGDYVVVCLIPGEKGVPHYAGHGMATRFHVSAGAIRAGDR